MSVGTSSMRAFFFVGSTTCDMWQQRWGATLEIRGLLEKCFGTWEVRRPDSVPGMSPCRCWIGDLLDLPTLTRKVLLQTKGTTKLLLWSHSSLFNIDLYRLSFLEAFLSFRGQRAIASKTEQNNFAEMCEGMLLERMLVWPRVDC